MSETPPCAPSGLVKDAVKKMGALSKLLCPIQRDLEDLALTLEQKEKDDSVVPRKDYDALTRDIEGLKKQVSELSSVHTSMKAKIDTLTTEKRDLEKQIQELEKERQDCDRIRARMERYLSERDSLRAHQSEWERAKVTMGRRFLNWLLRNHSLSHSAAADSAMRAWMHADGILENASAESDFESSDGFTVCPGNPRASLRLFSLPEPRRSNPAQTRTRTPKDRRPGKVPRLAARRPARPIRPSLVARRQIRPPRNRSRRLPSLTATRRIMAHRILTRPSWISGSVPNRRSELPRTGIRAQIESKGKSRFEAQRLGHCPVGKSDSDATKRPRLDPPHKTAKASVPSTKDMFGSDTDEEKPKPQGDTETLIRQIRDVYAAVVRAKPWRRYQFAVGSFLPDIPDSPPQHPRHAESVANFNAALSEFWQRCAEDVWVRMFMTSAKTDTKAWERLVYRLTRLVAELYILINYSDYKEDLIRFLCHPHPAWPQVFKNPINLLVMGKQQSIEGLRDTFKKKSYRWTRKPSKS
ncbi:hypothetical protein AeMF1_013517 [Aphanomyces euteiches]|nr:hypothetical protein AeMF1_013517 [Aphanomyces euteiches]KAH9182137.1 hypothetical protein AeNC1_015886 [Aphanomyces euteiches]